MKHLAASVLIIQLLAGGVTHAADSDVAGAAASLEGLRGIVRAADEASISSDLGFAIATLPFKEGESFRKGDILATFECGDIQAQLKSAEAAMAAAKIALANDERLARSNAAGKFEVEISRAKADQAAGEADAYRSKLGRCTIKAPFDGRIGAMPSRAHETPEPSRPIMHIVASNDLLVDVLVPSVWLRWLREGQQFSLSVDETAKTLPIDIVRIGATVDPVSQTVKVTGRFSGDAAGILPGMSGPTQFRIPSE
ncbi:efflux RND transporter periplasmic adaptor subunit [Rhizobium metallidurans]|uniref:RND family efflux transporter MFP subunit n=1 Tax=Rhizobium metallidurans TaxID=1265931 RepID=A0A7W6CMQ0_9HYPH|nr:efflux RND transporter periplasmic adaptor subunit [Rhizobium metallidurans]MBB3962834.1 RND family efflux transporter MFP subunit [Rhizobium metallidurans]